MKGNSIVLNFIFNFLKTLLRALFPVISLTYVTRILGPDGVGKVQFSRSFVMYFTSIAMLGVSYYGVREGARVRNDRIKLSKFAHEMLIINGISTIVAYVLLSIIWIFSKTLHDYTVLICIFSVGIVLGGMGMEWLYGAVEEYGFLAIRSMIFQALALLWMFIFVRNKSDVEMYAIALLISYSGFYVANFFSCHKFINFNYQGKYEIKKHLKPIFLLFAMEISIEMYTLLDTVMLGYLTNDTEVGYYHTAARVARVLCALIASLGTVLIPRISYLIEAGKTDQLNVLVAKSYSFAFMMSIPVCIGLMLYSSEVMRTIGGKGYGEAVSTSMIMSLVILMSPISMATNQQTFIPMRKEYLIVITTSIGAVVDMVLNFFLIPLYQRNGAAIATVCSELVVVLISYYNAKKYINVKGNFRDYLQYVFSGIVSIVPVYILLNNVSSIFVKLLIAVPISAGIYFLIAFFLRNEFALLIVDSIGNRINNSNHKM